MNSADWIFIDRPAPARSSDPDAATAPFHHEIPWNFRGAAHLHQACPALHRNDIGGRRPDHSRSKVIPYLSSFRSKVGLDMPRISQISPLFRVLFSFRTLRM